MVLTDKKIDEMAKKRIDEMAKKEIPILIAAKNGIVEINGGENPKPFSCGHS